MTQPIVVFVIYLRVSTDRQGRSGLGLKAQRAAVTARVHTKGGRIFAEHVEVESRRRRGRPELAAALEAAHTLHAVLLIAQLDRLVRIVAFVSNLMECSIEFVATDMPTVNRLTVHIFAAVAEEEARMISARTKAALVSAKARDVVLGNPQLLARNPVLATQANVVQVANARRRTGALLPYVEQARRAGTFGKSQRR